MKSYYNVYGRSHNVLILLDNSILVMVETNSWWVGTYMRCIVNDVGTYWWVIVDQKLTHDWYILGTWLYALVYGTVWLQVGAWLMHLFMVQVDYRWRYRLMHGWCMVQFFWYSFTAVYLIVIVWQWFHHSTSTSGWQDKARTGGCSHLPVVAREHWGL